MYSWFLIISLIIALLLIIILVIEYVERYVPETFLLQSQTLFKGSLSGDSLSYSLTVIPGNIVDSSGNVILPLMAKSDVLSFPSSLVPDFLKGLYSIKSANLEEKVYTSTLESK